MKIKEILTSRKQLIVGYRKEWLKSKSNTNTRSTANVEQNSTGYNQSSGQSDPPGTRGPTKSKNDGRNSSTSRGHTNADSSGSTRGRSQANVPIHDTFDEISNKTYESFDEQMLHWGQSIRKLKTGEAFGMFAGDPNVHTVKVDYLPLYESPELREAVDSLIEKNFESEYFISASEADREAELYRQQLLQGKPILLPSKDYTISPDGTAKEPDDKSNELPDPF